MADSNAAAGNPSSSQGRGLMGWILNASSTPGSNFKRGSSHDKSQSNESAEVRHRKQLAQILRYIATMHHSLGSSGDDSSSRFIRPSTNVQASWSSCFFQDIHASAAVEEQRCCVLFSTQNFRRLLALQSDSSAPLFETPPFSFYAAQNSASSPSNRKRIWSDAFRNPLNSTSNGNGSDGKACWLRLTRVTTSDVPEPPSLANPGVRRYLQQWKDQKPRQFQHCHSLRDMLTLSTIGQAPKINPDDMSRAKEIKQFLKSYKLYLRKREYQQALEPMYNQLFEWVQQTQHQNELVWGLGHARMLTSDNSVVNGPLLEVLMEVELAKDGALLVRPRPHTGLALNREVVSALMATPDDASVASTQSTSSVHSRLTQLHRFVGELEPLQMAPGQPATYIQLLKKMVVELSSGGKFQLSSKTSDNSTIVPHRMLVTEAWCLYSRPKPSSVWARDANAFADQMLISDQHELPKASWALTHGPSALDQLENDNDEKTEEAKGFMARLFSSGSQPKLPVDDPAPKIAPIVFPLPASAAQNRIADLLLQKNYPAVVTEGPPGTGKTHTIANVLSAYLSQGKRVLVTSKSAPALSVIRSRLPKCVQDLCVDVSMSELSGMRQLQQTVERLANRVSCVSADLETEKCDLLMRNIESLELEREEITLKLTEASDRKRIAIQQPSGQRLVSGLLELNENVPWLMKTVAPWPKEKTKDFRDQVAALVAKQNDDLSRIFLGECPSPVPREVLSIVSANAGVALASMSQATKKAFASVPLLSSVFGQDATMLNHVATITLDGRVPEGNDEWKRVLDVLQYEVGLYNFCHRNLNSLIEQEGWPEAELLDRVGDKNRQKIIRPSLMSLLDKVLQLKDLSAEVNISEEISLASKCSDLDARRSMISSQIQRLAEDLVEAKVVTEMSKSFSAEAQSALIRFSQIAGKAKFSRSSQPSKMTARQRRHRQEYLDAFDSCVRYIPCWIMTSSQISDYLPSECLFDLVVIDESSQSDCTVIPGMLRGKQWLIVGDGKQVSPTESFVSEENIESLRAALPKSPLEDSLLPGQSFFDCCAQAFPKGRVVLNEHFRCAPEIINFSNQQFYDGRLVPLRLPTNMERLSPSIIDVRIPNGAKVGKVNEKECDEIVRMVSGLVSDEATLFATNPRSIGIISLLGDEQCRLIRGRLLDRIGAHKFKEHSILIGDPPTFQGNERDVVYLSMVCSPGAVPTQNRLMHAQRMNVALSRARDRMVLVRSIDLQHIPNNEDIKLSVIEFFEAATKTGCAKQSDKDEASKDPRDGISLTFRSRAEALLENTLKKHAFSVGTMGIVWNNALVVEHKGSTARAALIIENSGETKEEWTRMVAQQKSIERVGWKCLRIDGLSLLVNFDSCFQGVLKFLASAGVEEPSIIYDSLEDEEAEDVEANAYADAGPMEAEEVIDGGAQPENGVVLVSSDDDDNDEMDQQSTTPPVADVVASGNLEAMVNDTMDEAEFGQVVNVDFLGGGSDRRAPSEDFEEGQARPVESGTGVGRARGRRRSPHAPARGRDKSHLGDLSDSFDDEEGKTNEEGGQPTIARKRRKSSYKRLDKYSRDGRYYPDRTHKDDDDMERPWYDTDSDLAKSGTSTEEEDDDYKPSAKKTGDDTEATGSSGT